MATRLSLLFVNATASIDCSRSTRLWASAESVDTSAVSRLARNSGVRDMERCRSRRFSCALLMS